MEKPAGPVKAQRAFSDSSLLREVKEFGGLKNGSD
jgi:hypothetical protein